MRINTDFLGITVLPASLQGFHALNTMSQFPGSGYELVFLIKVLCFCSARMGQMVINPLIAPVIDQTIKSERKGLHTSW